MTKFSTIVAIHLGDWLPSSASEELLFLAIKLDAILASSISSSLELSYSILALPFSWLALNAKSLSFFLVEDEPSCGVMCMYIS